MNNKYILLFKAGFLLVLLSLCSVSFAQEKVSFPKDFKLDSQILNGMVITNIPQDYKSMGIIKNPGVVTNQRGIRRLLKHDIDNVKEVYIEVYQGKDRDSDDAGVLIFRFESRDSLQAILPELKYQDNYAYLIKDNYLIQVWSDASIDSDSQIEAMVDYYEKKLKAIYFEPPRNVCNMETVDAIGVTEVVDEKLFEGDSISLQIELVE